MYNPTPLPSVVDLQTAIIRTPLVVTPDSPVMAAISMMSTAHPSWAATCVVVLQGHTVVGILTERDIVRLSASPSRLDQMTVQAVMTHPIVTLQESQFTDLLTTIHYLQQHQIRHLPLLDQQDRLVGLLTDESLCNTQLQAELAARQEAEAQLRHSEQRYASLVAASPVGILHSTLQGICSYANDRYCEILGIKPTALIGQPWSQGYNPEDIERITQEFEQATRDHRPMRIEYRIQRPDGSESWVFGQSVIECDSTGQAIGYVGTITDISDRKRAEALLESQHKILEQTTQALQQLNQELEDRVQARTQELQEREQFLQTVLDTFPLSVFWKDVNSVYLGCNQNFLRDAGLQTIEQIIGKTDYELPWGETEAALYRADDREVIETQAAKLGIVETLHQADGQTIWLETNKLPLRNLQGEVVGMLGTYQDISDRKTAELALVESQQQFRRMTENVPGVIYRYILRTDGTDDCLYISSQVREICELEPEKVLENINFLWARIHPDDVDQMVAKIAISAENLQPIRVEQRIVLPQKGLRWVQVNAQPSRLENGEMIWDGVLIDITDRKAAELALQESQAQFRRMTENVPGMIYRYVLHPDDTDELTYVSAQSREVFEVEPEAAIANVAEIRARIHPDDIPWLSDAIRHSAATLQPFTSEYRLCLPEKGLRWVQNMSHVERLANGDVLWDGIVVDITDCTEAEQRLQELSERLELAVQSAQLGIWEFDFSSARLSWDERMLEIYGVSPESFHGTHEDWTSRVHPDDLAQALPCLSKEQAIYNQEFRIIRPDGTVRWIMSFSFGQRNPQEELVRTVGVNLDITDRKAAELALQESQVQFRRLTENVPGMIYRYALYPDGREGFTYISPQVREIYEVEADQAIQNPTLIWARIHPDDVAKHQTQMLESAANLAPTVFEHRLTTPSGLKFAKASSRPHQQADGTIFWDGVVIDITDRKIAEQQLQNLNNELLRATRLKDEFLANMSHELRTPLNAILGATETLEDQIFGPVNDQQIKSLRTIEKSSNHLLELINDILDVAKIEAGQIELNCTPTSISELCRSSLTFIKQQALNKRIQLYLLIPEDIPQLQLDERRLRQVLINLLNNAVKFTSQGGQITLEVNYIPHATLEINVMDTGIGIAPPDIPRLFQPFVQVDSALNRNYNGTGLGLALVKRLVELHGGAVRLSSELGVGSCFTIVLPVRSIVETNPSEPLNATMLPNAISEIKSMVASPIILLVEDNESNITTISDYLNAKGFYTLVARSGQMALDLVQEQQPDLILMDIQMPGMDGLEAIQRIRQYPNCTQIPIIALTALVMPGDRERCLAGGANDYLSKPIVLKQLVAKIETWLV